jgi:hypothetical protein
LPRDEEAPCSVSGDVHRQDVKRNMAGGDELQEAETGSRSARVSARASRHQMIS